MNRFAIVFTAFVIGHCIWHLFHVVTDPIGAIYYVVFMILGSMVLRWLCHLNMKP